MPDWSDTVEDRERGEVVGYLGNNEPIADASGRPLAHSQTPIEDVRKNAIAATEAGGTPVVESSQAPSADAQNTGGQPVTNTGDNQQGTNTNPPASGDVRPL